MKQTIDISHVQQRFRAHIDPQTCYGKKKKLGLSGPKEDAFRDAEYILLPRAKHVYVGVDLDYRGAATAWEDGVFPLPTIVFTSKKTGHANIFWELKTPVYRRCELNQYKARQHPIDYFNCVQRRFTRELDGDPGYTSSTIKNPFSDAWLVQWHDVRYSLSDLLEYTDPCINSVGYRFRGDHGDYAGRNEELFTVARKWAYHAVFRYSEEEFEFRVYDFCKSYNQNEIPRNWPARGPLPRAEWQGMSRSIARWVLCKKDESGFKQRLKNIGAMGLSKILTDLSDADKKVAVSCAQALGAAYTHNLRKSKTASKIIEAIDSILADNMPITRREVSNRSGVARRTLNNYKEIINKANKIDPQCCVS